MVANRVNFVPGRDPSPSFLNRVQDPPTFNGTDRLDPYNSNELQGAWGINQRDGVKDYELDTRFPIGALASSGLVKGADIDLTTGLRVTATTGAPAVYFTENTPPGKVNIEVTGGSLITLDGGLPSKVVWDDVELTIDDDDTTYCWVDENGLVLSGLAASVPPPTQVFTPLFVVTVASGSIVGFDDLRPGVHTGYQPDNYFVFLNTNTVADTFEAESWQRVICDVRTNSFSVVLPPTTGPGNIARDGDKVAILDAYGTSDINNILVDPNGNTVNKTGGLVTLNTPFIHIVFVWCEGENSWYIESSTASGVTSDPEVFPLDYRLEAGDHTILAEDYRTWIDIDATLSTRVVTLPGNLDFGFECYVQSIGGTTVIVTSEASTAVSLVLQDREASFLAWVDNTDEGGSGIWKLLQGLTPGTGTGSGGSDIVNVDELSQSVDLTVSPAGGNRRIFIEPTTDINLILLTAGATDTTFFHFTNIDPGAGDIDIKIDLVGNPTIVTLDATLSNVSVAYTGNDYRFWA